MFTAVRHGEILAEAIDLLRSAKAVVYEAPRDQLDSCIDQLDVMLSKLLEDHRRRDAVWKSAVVAAVEGGESDEGGS